VPKDEKYPLALQKGTVLGGQYVIDKILGQGGFGITYKAFDYKNNNRPVAVKEYFPETLVYREMSKVMSYPGDRAENFEYGKKSFLAEAEMLAKFIGNNSIVRVYSYFEENGTAYFAMEYVDGVPFDKYLSNRGGRINIDEAKTILIPVMDALGSVHAKGIVHRDVTPDNIYISGDGRIMLLDFGAARQSWGDKSQSLDVVLKHGFAPKEQYARKGKQGPYTDVYSLGATFYFALTGRRPPDSVERMDEDHLIPPSALGVKITPYQEAAILKALNVAPQNRFQSMEEFKSVLLNETQRSAAYVKNPAPAAGIPSVRQNSTVNPQNRGFQNQYPPNMRNSSPVPPAQMMTNAKNNSPHNSVAENIRRQQGQPLMYLNNTNMPNLNAQSQVIIHQVPTQPQQVMVTQTPVVRNINGQSQIEMAQVPIAPNVNPQSQVMVTQTPVVRNINGQSQIGIAQVPIAPNVNPQSQVVVTQTPVVRNINGQSQIEIAQVPIAPNVNPQSQVMLTQTPVVRNINGQSQLEIPQMTVAPNVIPPSQIGVSSMPVVPNNPQPANVPPVKLEKKSKKSASNKKQHQKPNNNVQPPAFDPSANMQIGENAAEVSNISPKSVQIPSNTNNGQADNQISQKLKNKGLIAGIIAIAAVVVITVAALIGVSSAGSGNRSSHGGGGGGGGVYYGASQGKGNSDIPARPQQITSYEDEEDSDYETTSTDTTASTVSSQSGSSNTSSSSSSSGTASSTSSSSSTSSATGSTSSKTESTSSTSESVPEPVTSVTEPSTNRDSFLKQDLEIIGNTAANIKNRGYYASSGSTMFWVDEDCHSLQSNIQNKDYIFRNQSGEFSCLSYDNGFLYYVYDGTAGVVNTKDFKSSNVASLRGYTNIERLYVSNAYFFVYQNGTLYRINRESGETEEQLKIEYADQFTFYDGWVYYITPNGGKKIVRVSETDFTKVDDRALAAESGYFSSPVICDHYLYVLYVDNTTTTLIKKIASLSDSQDERWSLDTHSVEILNLNIIGNNIFFEENKDDETTLCHMIPGANGSYDKEDVESSEKTLYPSVSKSEGNYKVNYIAYNDHVGMYTNKLAIYDKNTNKKIS